MRNLQVFVAANLRRITIAICVFAFVLGFLTAFATFAHADETVTLTISNGKLIRLPSPAANVFVADPAIADVQVPSQSSIYILGKRAGRTTIYALGEDGEPIVATVVNVNHDLDALRSVADAEIPGNKVKFRSIPGSLVVDGTVASAQDAVHVVEIAQGFAGGDKVLNHVGVSMPTQVNLRVRVAEMSRDVSKQLGFQWDGIFSDGTFSFGLSTGRPGSAPAPDTFISQFTKGNFDVLNVIDALAEQGIVSTLAEPNLTAVSGELASFLAGGEFPIPVGADNNGIVIEFKKFGVSLDFTPTVLSPERISLKVRPEVSELSDAFAITNERITVPGIEVRRAETTVELASGQSFAIAGLMDNRSDSSLAKVPGIGSLPILGPLFQSSEFRRNETELIIIVTPYIVEPIDVAAKDIPTPIDGLKPTTDLERILQQRLARDLPAPGKNGLVGTGGMRLIGDAGFYY